MDKPVWVWRWIAGFSLMAIAITIGLAPVWVQAFIAGFCIGRLWKPFFAALGDTNAA